MIEVIALYKQYQGSDRSALTDLNLKIAEQEIFGLLGPNGAGKTTAISILCGLLKPTSGSFQIDGISYRDNKQQLQQRIGVVPQEYALYPTLTARENLEYFGAMYGLHGKTLKKKVAEGLELMGLTSFAHKKVRVFSGGMKRRVNLLASILHEPKVLFLDEPTVGVDVHSKNAIMAYLQNLNEKGTTIIYTSHHLNEAETFCTRVGIIDNGELITVGKPKDLVANAPDARYLEDVFISLTGKALRDHA
ncbi:MAG: ABC transporter ATP-binding protein [Flavobacteriaceae bacterium]|nr:ABC transporter ATP-binding protein [Flavobacteriaceae bacterium]